MITNGVIVYNVDMTAPYDVGTVATYSCDPGYELAINPGSEMRSCEDAGDGSGGRFSGQAPTCERKLLHDQQVSINRFETPKESTNRANTIDS